LDAEVLLAAALSCRRIELYTAYNQEPPETARIAFRELVRRRGEGTPVAYLVGKKEFYSLELIVNESVLIPRPESEHLVLEGIDFAKKRKLTGELRIADIGTGSGAVAIALAKHLLQAKVVATDRSPEALEVARRNVRQHQLEDRIELVQADLFQSEQGPIANPERFHIIVSNPPYVSETEYEDLSDEVRQFEPKSALVAGPLGTEIIERLLSESLPLLKPEGALLIELSPMIAERVRELAEKQNELTGIRLVRDLAGRHRVLGAIKMG
jgi:release factor glutamine methyltransferase